jgi:hypothetical protein
MTTCASVVFWDYTATQIGPLRGSVEWAKNQLVLMGITRRRVHLKKLSAKKMAEIITRLADAEQQIENHECESYREDW